jgi:dsRNA-specific ribonuclease
MSHTYVINSIEEFYNSFHLLKKDASIGSTPDVFRIGFISKDNQPDSYNRSKEWVYNTSTKTVACIVQMASDNVCLVINLTKMKHPIPAMLFNVFTSDSWIKMGVGVENDLSILSDNYNLGHCGGGIELKNLALVAMFPTPSLATLYNRLVGGQVTKSKSICDWSKDLTDKHLLYAAKDAVMSYRLGVMILTPSIDTLERATDDHLEAMVNGNNLDKHLEILPVEQVDKASGSNWVGELYEYYQRTNAGIISYLEVIDKDKKQPNIFCIKCVFTTSTGEYTENGEGASKKEAKQNSAKNILDTLKAFDEFKVGPKQHIFKPEFDYISRINEYTQERFYLNSPTYVDIEPLLTTPPKFRIRCEINRLDTNIIYKTVGDGVTKKEAKYNSAKEMNNKLNLNTITRTL